MALLCVGGSDVFNINKQIAILCKFIYLDYQVIYLNNKYEDKRDILKTHVLFIHILFTISLI